ncbi:hypothetical protein RCL1_003278 [Eukaryota sp. TZLM3-RCL]
MNSDDLRNKVEQLGFAMSDETLAILQKAFSHFTNLVSADVVAFAKHAKRKTISPQDVLLVCRRNPHLLSFMTSRLEALERVPEAED